MQESVIYQDWIAKGEARGKAEGIAFVAANLIRQDLELNSERGGYGPISGTTPPDGSGDRVILSAVEGVQSCESRLLLAPVPTQNPHG